MLRSDEDSEKFNQYFISVEQELMLETSTLTSSLFFCMSAYYIFNLAYHPKIKDLWEFFQVKVFDLPSEDKRVKCSPSAITHFSGISRYFKKLNDIS